MLLDFKNPFTLGLYGATTGSGKTQLAKNIVTTPGIIDKTIDKIWICLLYTSPSPRD